MINTLIHWLISALILWLMQFVPFMNINIASLFSLSFIFVAVVIGLINALIVPIVKSIIKGRNGAATTSSLILLIIDAAALWIAGRLLSGFSIGLITAIIAAVVLTVVGAWFAARKEK